MAFKQRLATCTGFAVIAVSTTLLLYPVVCAGGDSHAATPAEKPAASAGLSGSDLYAIHCNRCHSERYPKEFQEAQWKTLLTHMRVRANIPASQAREILKYLQDESGN